ncbi:hypothetical protein NW768_008760 [Fusarium equiseti]|uniref:Helitron helicase-like domain-containing protein n=1 Tax=Fusarium equiseti TaxID=61235 RepID=A0ABQ8R506_FUSEQ|nr:hypothetical protein NW768_008760 [Fusarium equiseti]
MSTSDQPSGSNTARQTSCEVCQGLSECTFRKYFNRAPSSNEEDWQQETESDRRRYYIPEKLHERLRLHHLAMENEILDRARPQRMDVMTAEEREIQKRNFARVEDCRRICRTLEQDHFRRFPVTGPDLIFAKTPCLLWLDFIERTSVMIGVYEPNAVQNSRYYLQHKPGTYIFKLRYEIGTGRHTFMGAAGHVTIGDFEYMGQVPRHRNLYDFRYRVILGDVMKLFTGELRELHTLSDPDQEPESQGPDPGQMLSTKFCTKVWELWKDFSNRSGGTLEALIVSATGTSLSELSNRWEAKERAAALNMLRSGDPDLMIYMPTPDTEDIHTFYSQARFDSDPLNPKAQFIFATLESSSVPTESKSTPSENPGPSSS